jgi:putative transposase
VVHDLFARRVVGWAVSDRLHQELTLEALRKALAVRRPDKGLIHHSDRGGQYCSTAYQAQLKQHGIRISMSKSGLVDLNRRYLRLLRHFTKLLSQSGIQHVDGVG